MCVRLCVCLCVCLSVCSLLRYHLNIFLPPLPEIGCPKFLKIQNPWGKVMERSGLRFKSFTNKGCKIAAQKNCFWANFSIFLWYRCFSLRLTVFLPPLPEVQCPNFLDFRNPWGKVMERSGLRFENFSLIKGVKLPRKKKVCFCGKFCLPSRIFLVSVLLSALFERFFVSRMQDFF